MLARLDLAFVLFDEVTVTKILLSAYACEPNRGSEPGLGWLWACEMASMGWDVTVFTSGKRHGRAIERYLSEKAAPFKIEYIDFWWPGKGESVRCQHLHYLVWLVFAGLRSRKMRMSGQRFDWCQQLTWATLRYPCFLAQNGRIVLGPMGGGERPPYKLVRRMGTKVWANECFRILSATVLHVIGVSRLWLSRATVIALANPDNLWCVPKDQRSKTLLFPAISLHDFPLGRPKTRDARAPVRLVFVGRFLSWKGLPLVLETLAKLSNLSVDFTCTLLGKGPEEESFKNQAVSLGLQDRLIWKAWVRREETPSFYDEHDIFLFPSLHDSGGMVVLEALARGLPVVCLKAGGPQMFVDETCGCAVDSTLSWDETIERLASSIVQVSDSERYARASACAVERARRFMSSETVRAFWKQVENRVSDGTETPSKLVA